MLFIKDFKPTQRDSNELLLFLYLQYRTLILYVQFLPDNEVRERQNVVQFLTFFKESFNAIFYSYLVTKRQNTIATNSTYITVN